MTKNRDDYKQLVESITAILQQLHQDVISNPDAAKSSEIFKEQCAEVHVCLSKMSSDLQLKFSPANVNVFGEVWSSGSLRDLISRYQKDIDDLRNNLILRVSIRTCLQVESMKANPASLMKEDEDDISEYRRYAIGDVRLIDQVHVSPKGCNMYTSRIHNCSEQKTVKLYLGTDAQKKWKEDFELISSIRHPHVQQLFGIIRSKSHPGLIFHEEMAFPIVIYRTTLDPIKHAIFNYILVSVFPFISSEANIVNISIWKFETLKVCFSLIIPGLPK
ncbi:hypothetical protein BDQ12DRAFT_338050 [Crucibulum laeve]|uniref:Uncharacterized protein n=1 Tax=Crucibulum laeve TaxID=68775 RepID=A0A5C3LPT7_9AGAR|nr:hypothetical protein BDQ12DRAFT_338050 [Crucibulum laeve]